MLYWFFHVHENKAAPFFSEQPILVSFWFCFAARSIPSPYINLSFFLVFLSHTLILPKMLPALEFFLLPLAAFKQMEDVSFVKSNMPRLTLSQTHTALNRFSLLHSPFQISHMNKNFQSNRQCRDIYTLCLIFFMS